MKIKALGESEVMVQLHGRLGNQLFQAAAGYALAKRSQARLVFDISRFREKGLQQYALAPFQIKAELIAHSASLALRVKQKLGFSPKYIPEGWNGRIYQEPEFAFDTVFEDLLAPVIIKGYFQSPLYFFGCADDVAELFSPIKLVRGEEILNIAKELEGEDSVSIHIRRGDYKNNKEAAAIHGILPESYYTMAVEFVRFHIPDARFFLFSDDEEASLALCEKIPNAKAILGRSAEEDFFLMNCARHHIIANSSFSWWSAWLDRRKAGICVAPKAWFTPEAMKTRPINDLIPEDWVQL